MERQVFPDIILTCLMEMNTSLLYDSFNLPYQAPNSSTFFHEAMANRPEIGQQKEFAYILFPAINGKSSWCRLSVVRGPLEKKQRAGQKKSGQYPPFSLNSKCLNPMLYALCSMLYAFHTTDY